MLRALALLGMLLAAPSVAGAAEWGTIEPGVSTVEQVRARYGAPSKETRAKVDGYDTLQWVYESDRAPGGLVRMTVDFGLLAQTGFKPLVVRLLKLEPKPLIFGRRTVVQGWGLPDGVGDQDGVRTFFYKEGLFVVFDKEGESAVAMIFSLPQPDEPEKSAPSAPPKK
jgi:hypothetical protein